MRMYAQSLKDNTTFSVEYFDKKYTSVVRKKLEDTRNNYDGCALCSVIK